MSIVDCVHMYIVSYVHCVMCTDFLFSERVLRTLFHQFFLQPHRHTMRFVKTYKFIEIFLQVLHLKLHCSGNLKRASVQRRPAKVLRNSALNEIPRPQFGPGPWLRDQGTKFKDPSKEKGLGDETANRRNVSVSKTQHCEPDKHSIQPVNSVRALKVQYKTK